MKILFWLNIGFDRGGPSVHLLQSVISSALKAGHSVDVILKDTGGAEEKMPSFFSENEAFTYTSVAEIEKGKTGFVKRYLNEISYAVKCRRIFKGKKYDVAFLQSCNAAAFYVACLRTLKCPIVFNVQDIFPQNLKFSGQLPVAKITYPVFSRLQKTAYKKADRLITISEDMKDTIAEQGIEREKIEVVYNWSYADDPIRFENIPEEQILDLGLDPQKTNVVYAGNIGKMQNVELIAKTAKLSKNDPTVHYYIIGDGANKPNVEQITEGLSNVTILPMQPSIYAESIYAQADVNVIPLAKGGIKTALPSKTATILRTDTSAVFCIDRGSKFEEMLKNNKQIRVADNSNPELLYQVICELRDDATDTENGELLQSFSKKNADRYVEIMADAVEINRAKR